MSKENPLSHHEQLRYDYLFKNIHYLNDREKREFDYLKRKMDGELPSNEREKNLGKDIVIPQYSNQSRSNRHQKIPSLPKVKKKKLGVEILIFRPTAVEAGLRNVKR